jgi:hypothetical protein
MRKSAYARRCGVSPGAVGWWIKGGMPLRADGKVDVDAADAWRLKNLDMRHARGPKAEARMRAAELAAPGRSRPGEEDPLEAGAEGATVPGDDLFPELAETSSRRRSDRPARARPAAQKLVVGAAAPDPVFQPSATSGWQAARARKEALAAERLEHKIAAEKGTVVPKNLVDRWLTARGQFERDIWASMPARFAPQGALELGISAEPLRRWLSRVVVEQQGELARSPLSLEQMA